MFRALIILTLALPANAEEAPLSAEAFEAWVTGKTLTYSDALGTFGIEEYLRNRRVRWSYLDGTCEEGFWYAEGQSICFLYEEIVAPQCWRFFLRNGRLVALFEADPEPRAVYQTGETDEPLICPGPKVGV